MTFWRLTEVLESVVLELSNGRPLSAAVLARSALEVAVSFYDISFTAQCFIREVVPHIKKEDALIDTQEFEEFMLKAIFGSREEGIPKHLEQTNILSRLKYVAKVDTAKVIAPLYARLCELAHPNLKGNQMYWVASSMRDDGVEVRRISRDPLVGPATRDVIWDAALALSASSQAVRQTFADNQQAVASVLLAIHQAGQQ
jgi:hypothetical protein